MAAELDQQPGQLLGAIFSASPDAVVVIDDKGTIVLTSPAVADLFGYYPEELVGEPIEILVPEELRERHREHIRHFFESPQARQMGAGLELAGRHRDGREFAVDVSLTPAEVRGTRYAAAFVRDARERKRAIDRLHAVNEITRRLLSGAGVKEILPLVAQRARLISASDAVWIVTPTSPGGLEITAVDGPGTEILIGETLSPQTSRSAEVMRTGTSEVVEDLTTAGNVPSQVVALGFGPGIYVPLVADERQLGTLVFGRTRGAMAYSPLEVAFAELFASAAAAAIELGEVRAELERLGIVSEDERIARDLHDTVIQQLFALGMTLQATRATVSGPAGERIESVIDSLDGVIKEIRNTIFRLPGHSEAGSGVRDEMLRLADKYRDQLGFLPRIAFDGPVDSVVPEAVATHLLQVFGEGLSNIARHAHASSVEVVVTIENGWLTLSLLDDGIGIADERSAGNGLRNIAVRASNLGGHSSVERRGSGGTILTWSVPLQ